MRVIICGGFYRTGSTWLFNLIKQTILESGGSVAQTGGTEPLFCEQEFLIHKTHVFCPELLSRAEFVFYSVRNMNEICASWQKMTGEPINETHLKVYEEGLKYAERADFSLDFPRIYSDKEGVATQVAQALGLSVNVENVLARLEAIKPPTEQNYDPESYLFRNHISPRW